MDNYCVSDIMKAYRNGAMNKKLAKELLNDIGYDADISMCGMIVTKKVNEEK